MTGIQNSKIVSANTAIDAYLNTTGGERGKPDHVLSASELRGVSESASKWRAGADFPEDDEDTESTFWGTLIDCLALQPETFEKRYAVYPETYPDSKTGDPKPWNNNATFCKEWKQSNAGKEFLHLEHKDRAEAAVFRLVEDQNIRAFLEASVRQVFVMAEWADDVTGLVVPLKGLIDLVPAATNALYGKCLGDLKTARCAVPGAWGRICFQRGYHVQAALYLDLYCAATGEDRVDFRHIVQESMPPYEPGRRFLSAEFIELGRANYQLALRRYCACLKANQWPNWDDAAPIIPGWSASEPEAWMLNPKS